MSDRTRLRLRLAVIGLLLVGAHIAGTIVGGL